MKTDSERVRRSEGGLEAEAALVDDLVHERPVGEDRRRPDDRLDITAQRALAGHRADDAMPTDAFIEKLKTEIRTRALPTE